MYTSDLVLIITLVVALVSLLVAVGLSEKKNRFAGYFWLTCIVTICVFFTVSFLAGEKKVVIASTARDCPPLSVIVHCGPNVRSLCMGWRKNRQAKVTMESIVARHSGRLIEDGAKIHHELNTGLEPFGLRVSHIEVTSEYNRRYPPE